MPVILIAVTVISGAIFILKGQVTAKKYEAGLNTKINTDCVVERKIITPSCSNFLTGILLEIR